MLILENKLNFKNQYKIIRNSDENTLYMKVAQNDETNPNMWSVCPPHVPSIANLQPSPFGPSTEKHRTSGILSRMFTPFAGITYPCDGLPLAQHIAASCFVLHLIALLFIVFPLRYSFPVDSETDVDAPVVDYVTDDPSLLPEQPGKPPLWSPDIAYSSLYCLH